MNNEPTSTFLGNLTGTLLVGGALYVFGWWLLFGPV